MKITFSWLVCYYCCCSHPLTIFSEYNNTCIYYLSLFFFLFCFCLCCCCLIIGRTKGSDILCWTLVAFMMKRHAHTVWERKRMKTNWRTKICFAWVLSTKYTNIIFCVIFILWVELRAVRLILLLLFSCSLFITVSFFLTLVGLIFIAVRFIFIWNSVIHFIWFFHFFSFLFVYIMLKKNTKKKIKEIEFLVCYNRHQPKKKKKKWLIGP